MSVTKARKTLTQAASVVIVLLVAGFAGVYLGGLFRGDPPAEPEMTQDIFLELALLPDSAFPDVMLQTEEFDSVSSRSLIPATGAVLLFIDPGCPPCHTLSEYWQRALDDGALQPGQVIGLAYTDGLNFQRMRKESGLTFPIYSDPNYYFMGRYGVDG
ncbi:MAG TPA: redoxin domain-containing protein, partial [candidate division Zixibacteria bacterium]|nr:redoxin domain-containing protein [candidate division Zixibacteria bacterium]